MPRVVMRELYLFRRVGPPWSMKTGWKAICMYILWLLKKDAVLKTHQRCANRWEVARRELQMLFVFPTHSSHGLFPAQISC